MDSLDTILFSAEKEWIFIADSSENLFNQLKPEEIKCKEFLTNKLS